MKSEICNGDMQCNRQEKITTKNETIYNVSYTSYIHIDITPTYLDTLN